MNWYGALPGNWALVRLGALGTLTKGSGGSKEDNRDTGVPVVRYGDLYSQYGTTIDAAAAFIDESDVAHYTTLPTRSIVFAASGESAEDIGKSALSLLPEPAVVGGDTVILSVNDEVHPHYLAYALESQPAKALKAIRATGYTVVHISAGRLKTLPVPVPPLAVQLAISDYLDRETAKIDGFIIEQQRLIDLLRERRDASRVALATRGIGDATRLIASGLLWSEWVPNHWSIVPLSSVASLESGHTPSRERPELWTNCSIPWISLNDVREPTANEYIASTKNLISAEGISASSARVLPAGTVVLSRDATVGRSSVMAAPMATSQHFANWICGPALDPNYLWLLFTSAMQPYFESLTNGSTLRTIGMGLLKSFRIPLPPLEEQRAIVHEARRQTAKGDALIAEVERFIELSRERRAGLIAAAVTGQIDIREVA